MPSPNHISTKLAEEVSFLNRLSGEYRLEQSPQTQLMRELFVRAVRPYCRAGHGLELGCSDGYMTEMIAPLFHRLDVVEGSPAFAERAKARGIPNASFTVSLFESFVVKQKYDRVFAVWILEHVADPQDVYRIAREALKPDGLLFTVVPNERALSRQLAVHMGLLRDVQHLTPNDVKHGHRRTYNRHSFNREIEGAGLEIVAQGGLMFKILADFQLDRLLADGFLGQQHVDGLYKLGLEYPDFAGSLYAVCRLKP